MRTILRFVSQMLVFLALAGVANAAGSLPFGPGERLTYAIYWTFIHAGDATLEVLPLEDMNGARAVHFRALAKTTSFVDSFYKVRDTVDAWTDETVSHSLLYKKDQHEGDYHKDVEVQFDWEGGQTRRFARGTLQHIVKQPTGTFDPLTILYGFRKQIMYKTMHFGAPVTDGKISVIGKAELPDMEVLDTPMGKIKCFKAVIDVQHLSGVFQKSPDAELIIWFSADERRLPVKVRSKVAVGHFTLELVNYRPSDGKGDNG